MLVTLFLCWWLLHVPAGQQPSVEDKPQNIILVIGDGMGLAHISMTEYLHKPPSPLMLMEVV